MNFRTVADLNRCIVNNLEKIPRDVDLVVGMPRSGMLPATLLALYLNLSLTDWQSFIDGRIMNSGRTRRDQRQVTDISEVEKVLVVDDSVRTGKTIMQVKEQAVDHGIKQELIYLAIFATPEATNKVDIYLDVCSIPRMFEWNYMHHAELQNCCVEIDGVICRDPKSSENDDGEKYKEFLSLAHPKFTPSKRIGHLVTCRLEKYRALTEDWLNKHGIKYNQLIMMNYPDKAARIAAVSHGSFKAEAYKSTKAIFFIESNYKQAKEIAVTAKKPVFCVDNQQYIQPPLIAIEKNKAKSRVISYLRFFRKRLSKIKKRLLDLGG